MSEPASIDSFIDKWRQRWPEWGVLATFVPQAQRARVAAWFSLQQELCDAAWSGAEAAPGLAKLAWWQEELRGWSRGARRHPLGDVLQKCDAPWAALAGSLSALPATRAPADAADDAAALEAFAGNLLACDAALFGAGGADQAGLDVTVCSLRAERALTQGDRAAATAVARDLSGAAAPSRPRRLHHALVSTRLRGFVDGQDTRLSPLRLLWLGWRAARGR